MVEPAIVQQLKVGARVAGERGLATTDEDGTDEQVALVDQPGLESVRSSRVLAVDTASDVVE